MLTPNRDKTISCFFSYFVKQKKSFDTIIESLKIEQHRKCYKLDATSSIGKVRE